MYDNRGDINAYSKILLGWLEPRIVEEIEEIELYPSTTHPDAIVLYPNNDKNSEQFFVVEYVNCAGNQSTRGTNCKDGLRIWRINEGVESNISGQLYFQECIQDNYTDVWETWCDGDEYTPYSCPSSYIYGACMDDPLQYSGVTITNIQLDDEKATFLAGIEKEQEKTGFTYDVQVQADNKLLVCLTSDTELRIIDEAGITVKNGSMDLEVDTFLSIDERGIAIGARDCYRKLYIKCDDITDVTGEIDIMIPAGTVVNSYGGMNEEIKITCQVAEETRGESYGYTDEKWRGTEVFSAGGLYQFVFSKVEKRLYLVQLDSEGTEKNRFAIKDCTQEDAWLYACKLGDESFVVCIVEQGQEKGELYHVDREGTVLHTQQFDSVKDLMAVGNNCLLITYENVIYVNFENDSSTILPYEVVENEFAYVGDNNIIVWKKLDIHMENSPVLWIELYNVDTGTTITKEYGVEDGFSSGEGFRSIVPSDNKIVMMSYTADANERKAYFTVFDQQLNIMKREKETVKTEMPIEFTNLSRVSSGYVVGAAVWTKTWIIPGHYRAYPDYFAILLDEKFQIVNSFYMLSPCSYAESFDDKLVISGWFTKGICSPPMFHIVNEWEDLEYTEKKVESIELESDEVILRSGETIQLNAVVSPTDADYTNVIWTSDDENVATVNRQGVVTAIGGGTATIVCTAVDGSGVNTECKVTVIKNNIEVSEENFPDENFRAYISEEFDADGDGWIDADSVTNVSVESKGIQELTGLELFKNLKTLNCNYNQLSSLDVSKNLLLDELWCSGNLLTVLDVSQNKYLTTLICESNELTVLDIGQNELLSWLSCRNNQLLQLDVSKNSELYGLGCEENCLTSLDVSANISLEHFDCNNNVLMLESADISAYDLSQLPGFDVSKVTAVSGGTINGTELIFDEGSSAFEYTYDCGNEKNATFCIKLPKLVEEIKVSEEQLELEINRGWLLDVEITPANAFNQELTWSSSDEAVAVVSATGYVTAVSVGEATITCTANDFELWL